MTGFKIINDDIAVRGLQTDNKQPVVTGPVQPVKASNPVQEFTEEPRVKALEVNKRGEQRSQVDRRQNEKPVLLDTRSQHERRIKNTRNSSTTENKTISPFHGLDETT